MDTYNKIVSFLSHDELEYFELESQSRKYVGYTLFQRHYYHYICEPQPPDDLCDEMARLNCNDNDEDEDHNTDDEEDDEYSITSKSINTSDKVSTGTDISSDEEMKYPKLSDIWNSLHATQQQFWSQRALKLNKTPLLGQFTNIPQSLIHNNMLSHQKIMSAITMDWQ